jgi:3-oxoacyl-[acyl-carrier protein] reductase
MQKDLYDLSGKVALVTGGSRGIGRAIALALAEGGSESLLNYSRTDKQAD